MLRGRRDRKLDGLFVVWLLSQGFLGLSFLRIVGDAGSALLDKGVTNVVFAEPVLGTQLGFDLMGFGAALIVLHSLLALGTWVMARTTLLAWPGSRNSQRVLSIFWFVVFVMWIMAANAYWYPRTSLGSPYRTLVATEFFGLPLISLLSIGLVAALVFVIGTAVYRRAAAIMRVRVVWMVGAGCLLAGVALPTTSFFGAALAESDPEKPHIVIIGVDSLRTDYVRSADKQLTPSIDAFMNSAVSFSDAYTPLARTFPAWVSIVSGRHPHTTGAFVNLLPRELIDEGETLPRILGDDGYQTVYAIDEVRFSNLDTSYGFDKMLAPEMGAADFLLGFFADTPLANLAVNTGVGAWLFPYGYANRAAADLYDPDTFVDRIDGAVEFGEPTLLAVHFTLAHWPYTWARSPELTAPLEGEDPTSMETEQRYRQSVARLDAQFASLMNVLERKGVLENALVILLSDHGESLGEASPIAEQNGALDVILKTKRLVGHGTHVFSRDQYNVLLGFQAYGDARIAVAKGTELDFPVSLVDITPTVLDMLGLHYDDAFDGESLWPYINGSEAMPAVVGRARFLETEFNPPGILPGAVIAASAILSAADKYRVDPDSGRVLVRTEFVDEILAKRQYAVERNGEILASVPAAGNYGQQYLLHYDLRTGEISWLDAAPSALDSQAEHALWQLLEDRFDKVRDRPVVPVPDWVSADL